MKKKVLVQKQIYLNDFKKGHQLRGSGLGLLGTRLGLLNRHQLQLG
jgi:hypothetical protein